MNKYTEIASRLRELREASDYSVEELAEYLGIDPQTYSLYEKDGKDIPISIIYVN